MDRITKEDIQELAGKHTYPCVSIYLPTERAGREVRQGSIRLANLLRNARNQLEKQNLADDAGKLLKPLQGLADDEEFWQHQSDGLAMFAAPSFFRRYRLPLRFEELAVVTDHFHLKPLLPLITIDGKFYVIALSQNAVRVFQGTRFSVSELDVANVPTSLAEALKYDDPEVSLQFRQGGAQVRGPGPGDSRAAQFHGHGGAKDPQKDNLLRYFQQIDHGMQDLLAEENAPLILAGVNYYFPIYREANSYRNLLDEGIDGNPEHLDAKELCARAWKIVEPRFKQQLEAAKDDFQQALSKNQGSTDLKQIVRTAQQGRVGTLFIARNEQQWGVSDTANDAIHLHDKQQAGDKDLLDYAALNTYTTNGTVYVVDKEQMPNETSIAAIFRY